MDLKKNSFKRIFIISLLMVALSALLFFAWSFKSSTNQTQASFAEAEIEQEETIDSSMSLSWGNEQRIQTLATSNNGNGIVYDSTYWTVPDNLKIVGGMTMEVSGLGIKFSSTDVPEADGRAQVITPNGYRVIAIIISNNDTYSNNPNNGKIAKYSNFSYSDKYDSIYDTQNIVSVTPEDIDVNYEGTIYFKVTFEPITYQLTMYYDSDLTDYVDDLSETKVVDFTVAESSNLSALTDKTANKEFGAWVLKDTETDEITITNDSGNSVCVNYGKWIFNYTKKYDGTQTFDPNDDGTTYYYVTTIKGYGNFNENTTGDKNVFAKWANIYNVVVDNSTNNWTGNTSLAGAYSNSGTNSDRCIATIRIKDDATTTGEFFSNVRKAFWATGSGHEKPTAAKAYGSEYYVYNYGYEISGWEITFNVGSQNYWLFYDGTKWSLRKSSAVSNIDNLKGTSSGAVASYLDNVANSVDIGFINGCPPKDFKITMKPIWKTTGVNIQVRYDNEYITNKNATGSTDSPIVYRSSTKSSYDLERVNVETGKSLMYYLSKNNNTNYTIALSGVWNYTNLSQKAFTYSSGTYVLDVTTGGAVDNIYKINLTGVKPVSTNTYNIGNEDYEFSESKAYENLPDLGFYTFENYPECKFKTYEEYGETNIEDYINDFLGDFYDHYTAGVAGEFEILRKVFATSGSLDETDATNKTFISSDPNFYIFLANGQETGDLPAIDTNSYELIFWEWDETNNHNIAFKTSNYEEESHSSAMNGLTETKAYSENKIWNLSDTRDNSHPYDINFLAHYFRKYYYIDIETLLDGEEGRFGYVLLDVLDNEDGNENSGKYLAIYDVREEANAGIKDILIYKLNSDADLENFSLNDTSISKTLMTSPDENPEIKIFAGCDLTIYVKDQSKDAIAMSSGNYDDMIGYRFKELTSQDAENNGGLFANDIITDYIKGVDASTLDDLALKSGTIITIQAHFEKIQYSLKVSLDSTAGSFTITKDGATSIPMTEFTFENIELGETLQITYIANVGYEFSHNAFKLILGNGHEKTLVNYEDLIDGEIIKAQYYAFTFDGKWLRVNYYSDDGYTDYSREDTHIGTIQIGTQGIPFNYGFKLYDSTAEGDGIIYEYWKITMAEDNGIQMEAGAMILPSVGEELAELSEGSSIWMIKDGSAIEYALLNSRLYFPANMLTMDNNYFTEYDFLLTEKPTQKFIVDSKILSRMCDCGTGDIVPFDSREIYMLLEVRELLSITMTVEADSTGVDTNSTERTTTITNGNNNSVDIITEHGTVVDGYYSIKDSETAYAVVAYTYNGLTNSISSKFDEKRYSGVQYFRNAETTAMTRTDFTLEDDASIKIKYIPKALSLSWKFFVDGEEKTDSEMVEDDYLDVIERLSSSIDREYKLNDEIKFAYKILNSDYEASVLINEARIEPLYSDETYSLSYLAQDSDYDYGGINIVVYLTKKPNSDITIKYALQDNSKSLPDDDYGSLSVIIGDGEKSSGNNFNVIEGRSVKVDISGLNAGYEFSGEIYHNNKPMSEVNIDGSIITLTESYNPGDVNNEGDSGTYVIYVNKVNVSATLNNCSNLTDWTNYYQIKDGTISSTPSGDKTKSTLNNLYVGKEITLWHKEVNKERLVSFYYDDGTEPVYIEETLKITSDLLELFEEDGTFNIQIKFEVKKRYQISVEITEGADYVSSWGLTKVDDFSEVRTGTYFDEGTEINLKLDTLMEGKYKIIVAHNVLEPTLEESYAKLDLTYTLNQDVRIEIKVQKETFAVNVSENIYSSLEDLNSNPQEVETGEWVNGINVESSVYESDVTLNVVRVKTDDRRLQTITISGNDMAGTIKIEFVDAMFKIYYQETEEAEFEEISSEKLTELGFKITNKEIYGVACVSLNYTALNEINITCDYIDFKIITAE